MHKEFWESKEAAIKKRTIMIYILKALFETHPEVEGFLSLIALTPRLMAQEIAQKFDEKEQQLKIKTRNPEDVSSQREYITGLPNKLHQLKTEIDLADVYYKALEELNYQLSDSDFSQKWEVQSRPSKLEKLVEKTEKVLAADNERYQREMDEDQRNFIITLDNLESSVTAFGQYTDLSQDSTRTNS
eukprot:Gb_31259 [translate_table: standard]